MFFSIATLALAVVVQTLITNWDFVGGARGAYVLRPRVAPLIGGEYVQYLFLLMLGMCVIVLATARAIERSRAGLRLRRHPRRRGGGRGLGRADAAG